MDEDGGWYRVLVDAAAGVCDGGGEPVAFVAGAGDVDVEGEGDEVGAVGDPAAGGTVESLPAGGDPEPDVLAEFGGMVGGGGEFATGGGALPDFAAAIAALPA